MTAPDQPWSYDREYSPPLSIDFVLHGERVNVASICSEFVVFRDPRPVPPGRTTIRLIVDGRVTLFEADVWDGVDPNRRKQPLRSVRSIQRPEGDPPLLPELD